jgi:hypothetical protein
VGGLIKRGAQTIGTPKSDRTIWRRLTPSCDNYRAVIVTVISVGMMQMAPNQVVHVIAMRDALV